jgi:DnaK suppressor protein
MKKKELDFFRETLKKQLEHLARKSEGSIAVLVNATVASADPLDRAALESERELAVHMMERDKKLMVKIKKALQKIDDRTFGICEECEEAIDIARLKLRPVTELCIQCKKQQERVEKLTCDEE